MAVCIENERVGKTLPENKCVEHEFANITMDDMDYKDSELLTFNATRAKEKLSHIKVSENINEKVKRASDFIKTVLLNAEGDILEIGLFIENDVFTYFGIPTNPRDPFSKALRDSYKTQLNARKKQQNNKEKMKDQVKRVTQERNISPEFEGMYKVDEEGNITPCPDEIAKYIVEKMNVITYKDNIYCYDDHVKHYIEASHAVGKEITRVLGGISSGVYSNGISHRVPDVERYVRDINRCNEYPFTNVHKVIPFKSCVIKIDQATGEITVLDNEPEKYILNYTFPITYDPDAPTEPVLEELRKYVKDPYAIIQIMAQTVAQTILNQPLRNAYMLYGKKRYGKTTISLELIGNRFLSNGSKAMVPLNMLSTTSENRFNLSALEGKQMNIFDDTKDFNMQEAGTFKTITGSYDIRAEYKGKDPIVARSTAVHMFNANKLPSFGAGISRDDAFCERWILIEFNQTQFDTDANMSERTFTPVFMSGLLNLVLDMVIVILRTGTLPIKKNWEETREEWLMNSNVLYPYFIENMERGGETKILKRDLVKQLQLWYDNNIDDQDGRPSKPEDLTEVIKLCGGDLNAEAIFELIDYDANHHIIYEKDENGNPTNVPKMITKRAQCYSLPWHFTNYSDNTKLCRKPVNPSYQTYI